MAPGVFNHTYHFALFVLAQVIGQSLAQIWTSKSAVPQRKISSHGPSNSIKFCKKCSGGLQTPLAGHVYQKPERAHHCKICQRCTGRMDHHCQYLGKCIGAANYKPFFVFVLGVVASLNLTVRQAYLTFEFLSAKGEASPTAWGHAIWAIAAWWYLLTFAFFDVVLLLFSWHHLRLTLAGLTSIELFYLPKDESYSFGALSSLRQIWGDFWGFPLGAHVDKWEGFFSPQPGLDWETVHPLHQPPPEGRLISKTPAQQLGEIMFVVRE